MPHTICHHKLHQFLEELDTDKGFGHCELFRPKHVTSETIMTLHFVGRDLPEVNGTFDQLRHFFDMDW